MPFSPFYTFFLGLSANPNTAYSHLKLLLKWISLPGIHFHDLRHVFATNALEQGMDVKTLSAIIGHTSSATTLNIYVHVTSDMRRQAAAKLTRVSEKQKQRNLHR